MQHRKENRVKNRVIWGDSVLGRVVSEEPPEEVALSRYLRGQHVLWFWCEAALGGFREQ